MSDRVVSTTGYGISPIGRKVAVKDARANRYRKAMALKEQLGLSDDERYELARMLPRVDKDDGGSWKDLDGDQLHDLITMMEGYIWISYMMMQR